MDKLIACDSCDRMLPEEYVTHFREGPAGETYQCVICQALDEYDEDRMEAEAWLRGYEAGRQAQPEPEGGEDARKLAQDIICELFPATEFPRYAVAKRAKERDALRSRVEELEAGLKSMVVQFAYWSEKDGGGLWCGGLSALEEAFDLLGFNGFWKRNDLACQFEGCSERADCGTPQDDGPYLWLCQKHYCYVVDTGNVRLKAALGGGTGGV